MDEHKTPEEIISNSAAPAPETTIRTSDRFFSTTRRPLRIAAVLMIAVPC